MSEIKEAGEKRSAEVSVEQEHHWPEDMGRSLRQWAKICAAVGIVGAVCVPVHDGRSLYENMLLELSPLKTTEVSDGVWIMKNDNHSFAQFQKDYPELKVTYDSREHSPTGGLLLSRVLNTEPASKSENPATEKGSDRAGTELKPQKTTTDPGTMNRKLDDALMMIIPAL